MAKNDSATKENTHTYTDNGSVFIVHREFDDKKTIMLEQILNMLLDMMDKTEEKKV